MSLQKLSCAELGLLLNVGATSAPDAIRTPLRRLAGILRLDPVRFLYHWAHFIQTGQHLLHVWPEAKAAAGYSETTSQDEFCSYMTIAFSKLNRLTSHNLSLAMGTFWTEANAVANAADDAKREKRTKWNSRSVKSTPPAAITNAQAAG